MLQYNVMVYFQIGFLGICGKRYPVVKGPNKIGRDPQMCNIVLNLNVSVAKSYKFSINHHLLIHSIIFQPIYIKP